MMKTCPDCRSLVYALGCVYCNESAYIEEQEARTAEMAAEANEAIEDAKREDEEA